MCLFNRNRLRLLITNNCNFDCTYCHNEGQFGKNNFLKLSFVKKFSKWLKDEEIQLYSITISGGEPTSHPELLDIITCLNEFSQKISIVTNGSLLNKQKINELADAGLSYIKFGVDQFNKDRPKPITNTVNMKNIFENISLSKEKMPDTSINTVVSEYNFNDLTEILRWCISRRINIKFLELIDFPQKLKYLDEATVNHNWFTCVYKKLKDLLIDVEYNPELMKFSAKTIEGTIVQFSENFCKYGACGKLWSRIDSKGCLIPCIHNETSLPFYASSTYKTQLLKVNQLMKNPVHYPCGSSIDSKTFSHAIISGDLIQNIRIPLTNRIGTEESIIKTAQCVAQAAPN